MCEYKYERKYRYYNEDNCERTRKAFIIVANVKEM